MKILLPVFIFSFYEFYIISVRLPCQPKTYIKAMIRKMSEQDGKALACLPNLGFHMCVHMCERTTNCSYVEHDLDTLLCCLMKAENDTVSVSNCSLTFNNTVMEFMPAVKTQQCGQWFCPEATTCNQLKSGGYACVDLIDLIEKCSIDRYLVTGKYGVSSNRVSFSSVKSQPHPWHYIKYQLDSDFGWNPDSQLNQWIQVLFGRSKLVTGIVTKGVDHENRHVTEYRIEYLSLSYNWKNVQSPSGNVTIFPGNIDGITEKVNYLQHPIRTPGIRLSPVSWYGNRITMRFDVLGC